MTFAQRLKQAMDDCKISQAELSVATGIGRSSISQYLSGKNIPRTAVIEKLALALSVDSNYFQDEEAATSSPREIQPRSNKKKMTTRQAARLMGKSEQFVRKGLQSGVFPFGYAVKTSTKWAYYINPEAFAKCVGLQTLDGKGGEQ